MPVGVKAKRQLTTQLLLDVVAVLLCLLTAKCRIATASFGFNYCQGLAIFTKKDVITELVPFVGYAEVLLQLRTGL